MLSVTLVATVLSLASAARGQAASTSASSSGGVAGLIAGLSQSCQAAAGSLLSSDFGTCANIVGLVSVIGAQGSVVSPLTTYINAVCSTTPCSDSTIATATASVNSGCSADVAKGSTTATSLYTIVKNYRAINNLMCTQYVSNSTFCVPTLLSSIQTASGKTISIAEVEGLLTQGPSAISELSTVAPGTYCTDCGHAFFAASSQIVPITAGLNITTAEAPFEAKCGANFSDNKIPSTIKIAGSSSSSGSSSLAASAAQGSGAPRHAPVFGFAIFVFSLTALLMI